MTKTKHKRKASSHSKANKVKKAQSPGLIALYPKVFVLLGLFFIALGISLLAFKPQDNAIFGLAMLAILAGVVISFYAKFPVTKNNTH
ncbi:MAG: hypothetical protein HRT53_16370 [Colwellia sp.]|nr:hypothetical protein [Colwellia sp.]